MRAIASKSSNAHILRAGNLAKRLPTRFYKLDCLLLLTMGEHRLSVKPDAVRHGPRSPLRPRADQFALEFHQVAKEPVSKPGTEL